MNQNLLTKSTLEFLSNLFESIDDRIKELQVYIKELPAGNIQLRYKNDHYRFYHCTVKKSDRIQKYLPSDSATKVGEIHKRLRLERELKDLIKIRTLLKHDAVSKMTKLKEESDAAYNTDKERVNKALSVLNDEQRRNYLQGLGEQCHALRGDEKIKLHNSNNVQIQITDAASGIGNGTIETLHGILVRSKSELIILDQLLARGLEVYYEQGILLNNYVYRPDFLIRHPDSKDFLIWEHFGLMNDTSYREKVQKKIATFFEHDIIPCVNLILTYENGTSSFNVKSIQEAIDYYF